MFLEAINKPFSLKKGLMGSRFVVGEKKKTYLKFGNKGKLTIFSFSFPFLRKVWGVSFQLKMGL